MSNADESISIISVNVRSLKANFEKFLVNTEQLETRPQVIIVSETWLSSKDCHSWYNIEGYNMHATNRPSRGGGVCIYIDEKLKVSKVIELAEGEMLCVEVQTLNKKVIRIIALYKAPSDDNSLFLNKIESAFTNVNKSLPTIIGGDFNIDLLSDNKVAEDLTDTFSSFNCSLLSPLAPTRETVLTSTCIDHIWGNVKYKNSIVHKSGPADHFICQVDAIVPSLFKKIECDIIYRNLKPLDSLAQKEKFDFLLLHKLKKVSPDESNSMKYMACITDCIKYCFDRFCPLRRVVNKRIPKSWVTNKVKRVSSQKSSAYRNYIDSPTDENWVKYKTIRNKSNALNKLTMKKYWRDKLETGNNKEYHRTISKFLGWRNKSALPDNIDQEVCTSFNEFFINIGPSLSKNVKVESTPKLPMFEKTIVFKKTEPKEVLEIINNLASKNSSGIDGISSIMLKKCANIVSPFLATGFNKCIEEGVFPDDSKISRIFPLFKEGDNNDFGNYRPISLLSVIAKVFERIIYLRLIDYFERFKLLSDKQFGFRSKLSTINAALNLTEEIRDVKEQRQDPYLVLLDLKKAFDTVDHDILMSKLNSYGIRGVCYNLLRSYLSNRKQFVEINGFKSSQRTVKCGVPQGSVLGPLLFLIYINDLPSVVNKSTINLFADDTSITKNSNSSLVDFQNDLNCVDKWMRSNKLTVEPSKSKLIVFNKRKNIGELRFAGKKLKRVQHGKYLGIRIDDKLNFKEHISYVRSKLVKFCGSAYRLRQVLNIKQLLQYYKRYVQPVIQYGLLIYGATSRNALMPLLRLQKRYFRIILRKKYRESVMQAMEFYKIPNVFELHVYEILKAYLSYSFKENHAVNTRSSSAGKLQLPMTRTRYKYLSVHNKVIRLANIVNNWKIHIPKFDTKKQQNQFAHDFLDSYIIGNSELIGELYKN